MFPPSHRGTVSQPSVVQWRQPTKDSTGRGPQHVACRNNDLRPPNGGFSMEFDGFFMGLLGEKIPEFFDGIDGIGWVLW